MPSLSNRTIIVYLWCFVSPIPSRTSSVTIFALTIPFTVHPCHRVLLLALGFLSACLDDFRSYRVYFFVLTISPLLPRKLGQGHSTRPQEVISARSNSFFLPLHLTSINQTCLVVFTLPHRHSTFDCRAHGHHVRLREVVNDVANYGQHPIGSAAIARMSATVSTVTWQRMGLDRRISGCRILWTSRDALCNPKLCMSKGWRQFLECVNTRTQECSHYRKEYQISHPLRLTTTMATEKIVHNLQSFCLGENRLGELEIEVALLDINDFDHESKHPNEKHRGQDPSLARVGKALLRVLFSKFKSLLARLASDFANEQWYFKPRELLPAWWKYSTTSPPTLHPSSWLDGLRGVAALFVFFHHSSQIWLQSLRPGWGSGPDAYHIMQLPILRVVYSGGAMVSLFFVISGYVLSTKPLRLAREGKTEELLGNLASSTFRRGPRLFIPCIVSTFITAMLAMMGAFVDEGVSRHYPRAGSLSEQIASWVHETLWFINPFATRTGFEENLWTIPIEFQGSLLIFLCVLGLSRCRTVVRLASLVCLMAYWAWFGYWATVLFLGGMLLADISHSRSQSGDGLGYNPTRPNKSWKRKATWTFFLLVVLFLLSMPEYSEAATDSYGYATLATSLTPESWRNHWGPGRWWPCLSSLMLVAIIDHAGADSIFQKQFTYRFPQYLGRISFSLYLCHGVTLYTLGLRVVNLAFQLLGSETDLRYGFSLVVSGVVVVPLLFWISDVFTVVVDRGAITCSRRLMKA